MLLVQQARRCPRRREAQALTATGSRHSRRRQRDSHGGGKRIVSSLSPLPRDSRWDGIQTPTATEARSSQRRGTGRRKQRTLWSRTAGAPPGGAGCRRRDDHGGRDGQGVAVMIKDWATGSAARRCPLPLPTSTDDQGVLTPLPLSGLDDKDQEVLTTTMPSLSSDSRH